MEEQCFRNKVTCYSFIFSILVVWIHACNQELFLGAVPDGEPASFLEQFVAGRIGQIAVPGFFMISGCLFFRHLSRETLPGKLERRIYSVLVPYILWNFLYYLGYVIGSRIPGLTDIMGRGVIPFNLRELTEAVVRYKYNPVFWFLFQLLLLIALSPVLYAVLKRASGRCIFFAALWVLLCLDLRLPFINADAMLYFTAAGTVPLVREDLLFDGDPRKRAAVGAAFLFAAACADAAGRRFSFPAAFVLDRLLAVSGLWLLVPAAKLPEAGCIMKQNFFLYATHFALVRLINKTAARLSPFPASPMVPLVLYLLMPGIVLALSSAGYALLRRLSPGLCRILNGNRG